MKEVRMYYADTLDDVIGKQFRGQNLTFVLLNYEKIRDKDEDVAKSYIHKQDPRIALGGCKGRQGFEAEVEDRRSTFERNKYRDPEPLLAVVVESLPSRARGLLSWFDEIRERIARRRVNALEEQWPSGSASNVQTLLSYLRHPSPRVRETAVLAVGEYLPVIVRQSGRTAAVEKAVAALLAALETETAEPVLTNIGSALGNTASLTTANALTAALTRHRAADVAKVAEGLRLLRPTDYRTELLEALRRLEPLPPT